MCPVIPADLRSGEQKEIDGRDPMRSIENKELGEDNRAPGPPHMADSDERLVAAIMRSSERSTPNIESKEPAEASSQPYAL